MTDTRKLLDDSPDELTQRLLSSALDDRPSSRAFSRTAAALGVSGLVPLASGAAAASTSGGIAAGTASTGVKLFGLVGLKWFGLGALAGLIVAGGASSVLGGDQTPSKAAAAPTVGLASNTEVASAAGTAEIAMPQPEPITLLGPERTGTKKVDVPSNANEASPPVPAAKTPTIAREIAALDGARAALKRNDPAAALSAVDALERQGATALGPEATVIRVEALLARGETEKATALARRFMAENPSTPHAKRMREIIRNQK